MSVPVYEVADKLLELSNWNLTNLQLQKLLYLANMIYAGREGVALIEESFEAWNYGPVIPELYNKVKIFGDKKIKDIFGWNRKWLLPEEEAFIEEFWKHFKDKSPSQLIAITHRSGGAWQKNYR